MPNQTLISRTAHPFQLLLDSTTLLTFRPPMVSSAAHKETYECGEVEQNVGVIVRAAHA